MVEKTQFKRHVAQKVSLATITSGTHIKEAEDAPNFLLTQENKKVYRINVMGIIISIEKTGSITSMLLDDSTDVMTLRFFEESSKINAISVGSSVLIVGKVRTYNGSMYVTPEIIKEIDPAWLKVRAHELKELKNQAPTLESPKPSVSTPENVSKVEPATKELEVEDFTQEAGTQQSDLLPEEILIDLIRTLDTGEGVAIEDIIEKSTINNAEDIIQRLIANGEIFNNLPGKVKVL